MLDQKAKWTWSVESFSFTPKGSTTPVNQVTDQAHGIHLVANDAPVARTDVVPPAEGTYTVKVRAKCTCETSECGANGTVPDAVSDPVSFSTASFVLHPNASDFKSGYEGRVLLSKQRIDDSFYTIARTTKANTPAQFGTGNHQVTITAHLPQNQVGTTIYFRVSNPADRSPYITLEPTGGDGPGTKTVTSTLCMINGSRVAAAEFTLDLGSSSGNAFQVEASLKPFLSAQPSDIQITPPLIAWKRCYLEQVDMYQPGRPMSTYSAPTTLLEKAYGHNTDGSDGGAFIEFKSIYPINRRIDYKDFRSVHIKTPDGGTNPVFLSFWRTVFLNNSPNSFLLAASSPVAEAVPQPNKGVLLGRTQYKAADESKLRMSWIFFPEPEIPVHELAHQFEINSPHVDRAVSAPNIDNSEDCVMTYQDQDALGRIVGNDAHNNIARFDYECYLWLRGARDPR